MGHVKSIPDGSSSMIPMLVCRNVAAEVEFCKTTFEAIELGRRRASDGTVVHSLLSINKAMIIIEGEWPTLASRAPKPDGSSPVVIFVYVDNVDRVIERAVAAGGRILLPVKNQFWGDRTGRVIDSAGHVWTISSRIEETSSAERDERWDSMVKD